METDFFKRLTSKISKYVGYTEISPAEIKDVLKAKALYDVIMEDIPHPISSDNCNASGLIYTSVQAIEALGFREEKNRAYQGCFNGTWYRYYKNPKSSLTIELNNNNIDAITKQTQKHGMLTYKIDNNIHPVTLTELQDLIKRLELF